MLKVASANSLGLIEIRPTPLGLIKGGGVEEWLFMGCHVEGMFSKVSMCAIMQWAQNSSCIINWRREIKKKDYWCRLERLTIQRFYKSGSNTIIEQERKLIKRRRIKIFLSFIMYINGFVSIEKKSMKLHT